MYRLLTAGLTLILLSGCAHHLTEAECKLADWHQVGVADGQKGAAMQDLKQQIEDCDKFNIPVDLKAYAAGYKKGVKVFCTPGESMGVLQGQMGRPESEANSRQAFCTSNGLVLNLKQYHIGYQQGIKQFCTTSKGSEDGLAGRGKNTSCNGINRNAYAKGWLSGTQKLCTNKDSAFAYGKSGKSYPRNCNAANFPAFKNAYDRGHDIKARIDQLQGELDSINRNIRDLASKHKLKENSNVYTLGEDKSPEAKDGLKIVRQLARKRDPLQNQLFKAKLAH